MSILHKNKKMLFQFNGQIYMGCTIKFINIIMTLLSSQHYVKCFSNQYLGSQIGRGYPDVTLAGRSYITIMSKQKRNESQKILEQNHFSNKGSCLERKHRSYLLHNPDQPYLLLDILTNFLFFVMMEKIQKLLIMLMLII